MLFFSTCTTSDTPSTWFPLSTKFWTNTVPCLLYACPRIIVCTVRQAWKGKWRGRGRARGRDRGLGRGEGQGGGAGTRHKWWGGGRQWCDTRWSGMLTMSDSYLGISLTSGCPESRLYTLYSQESPATTHFTMRKELVAAYIFHSAQADRVKGDHSYSVLG